MLSTNVLCIKKKKKKSYCITGNKVEDASSSADKSKRSATMLQITEDTPPDMLAGAMDLTVHLPTGRAVKMSVERSTPMMDLLVQITTNYHLQLSGYTLQALGMAPSKEHSDCILPYKPNTPIGALDTQHIKVIAKAKNLIIPKNIPPGHQPFESTFRLKVHLPRNQLFVTRVSHSVHLEDIMKKVCEEKNLDPVKYEFRHPGNLDEILDPKLTLNDYAITEIYLVQKGTVQQSFSSNDIMSLRKEEERKQMHTKTGGGVFNLIFRRGKSSTGSLSSENRSISPTHSDDSRSVTPPGIPTQLQPSHSEERPKPPQRKRRPAPKPPIEKKLETNLTVCHSRNSSDSSGYHEASILSDNCNASLPRRPKSTVISEETHKSLSGLHSQSTSNLTNMAGQSKSTSSLAVPSRKKKSAPPPPPPPPVLKSEKTKSNLEEPSPVVASQPCTVVEAELAGNGQQVAPNTNPKPTPRTRFKHLPNPRPRSFIVQENDKLNKQISSPTLHQEIQTGADERENVQEIEVVAPTQQKQNEILEDVSESKSKSNVVEEFAEDSTDVSKSPKPLERKYKPIETKNLDELSVPVSENVEKSTEVEEKNKPLDENIKESFSVLAELQKSNVKDFLGDSKPQEKVKPPEVVALHPKEITKDSPPTPPPKSMFDSYSRKRGFQIGSSLLNQEIEDSSQNDLSTPNSVASALNAFEFVDEINDVDVEMFKESSKNSQRKTTFNQLHGIYDLETFKKNPSGGSLRSVSSFPGFVGGNMKKWKNLEDLDDISLQSFGGKNGWVIGDTSDTESITSTSKTPQSTPLESLNLVVETVIEPEEPKELETDWQYQLPSPPKAFRDSSPLPETQSIVDSVVTSPELFEKLKEVKESQASDLTSTISEESERPPLNKLSLENLEKRKSLVYNRELATSLKMPDEDRKETFTSSLVNFEKTYDEVKHSSLKTVTTSTSTLPNFKITTYNPKQKLDIFEDDTVRSNTRNSFVETKNFIGRSMENISMKKPEEDYKFYRPPLPKNLVFRSESLTKQDKWTPSKPVSRSKSQIAINKYQNVQEQQDDGDLTKSNSLYDVSGLQSLEVMRLIQNKLSNSSEKIEETYQKPPESEVQNERSKVYSNYRAPAVNMGTWSERPKIPVNVKQDPDYKFSVKDTNNSKLIVNTVEIRNNSVSVRVEDNTGIKRNSFENPKTGNVVIKIEGNKPIFRKPLGDVNTTRPHSIALSGDFDMSRVPIVRSVELKKPYKDYQNTSITQINQVESKPVVRVNSYLNQNTSAPVVRGFRSLNDEKSWTKNQNNFSTLPAKPRNYALNAPVPFSQVNLRRTESIESKVPPAAPVMPKLKPPVRKIEESRSDPKEELLQAIRDFGGKKGLRTVKA